jgi:type I restriction enzyme S subunit
MKLKRSRLTSGDVIYPCVGTIGNAAVIEQSNTYHIQQNIARITPIGSKLNSYFLSHYLMSELAMKEVERFTATTSQPSVLVGSLRQYRIPLPCKKSEQTAIASALSDVDALITSLEKLIAKKRAIKTAAMQQLLTGKKRLPPFDLTHTGYKQTELGEIPEDWEIRDIGSFTDCTAGGTPSTGVAAYWGGDNPWMSSGELHLKRVKDVDARITDVGLKNSSTKYIPKNCVLMGLAGQGKTRGTVAVNEIELCTNQSIAAIFPSDKHETDFLYYNLETRYDELRGMSTGDGGRGGLNLTIIKKIPVAMPSIEEQRAIVTVLSDIDKDIEAHVRRLNKTQQLKQGMMQELLTGRTRLL